MDPMGFEYTVGQNLGRVKQEVLPIPKSGPFEKRSFEFPCEVDRFPAIVQVIIGPLAFPPPVGSSTDFREKRYVELNVRTREKDLDASTWVYCGTNDEIQKFLSDQDKSLKVFVSSIKRCVESLKKDKDEEWGKQNFPSPR